MADKNFEIGINTTADTSGAAKAEAALDDVSQAADELNDQGETTGFGGMLDGVPERADEAAGAVDKVSDETGKLTKATAEQVQAERNLTSERKAAVKLAEDQKQLERENERAEQVALDVRKVKQLQIAEAVGAVGQGLAGAATKAREFAEATRGVDKNLANQFQSVATGFEALGGAATGAAAGFAVGGPVGAIIGGIAGLASPALKKGLDDLFVSLGNLAEAKGISADLPARIEAVKKSLLVERQAESWRQLREQISAANEEVELSQKLAATARAAQQFFADEAVRVAEAGGDPAAIAAARINARDVSARNAAQQNSADVAAATNNLNSASTSYQVALAQSDQAARSGAANQKELAEEARKLKVAYETARRDFEAARAGAGFDATRTNVTGANNDVIAAGQDRSTAGRFTADQISEGLAGLEGQLGDVANLPPVRSLIDQVKDLAADGIQASEQNQVVGLVQQLVAAIKKPNEDTRKNFTAILEAVNSSVDVQNRLSGQIDELKRRVQTIESTAGSRNP